MNKARLTVLLFTLTTSMAVSAQNFQSRRPAEGERLFTSEKIESVIDNVTAQLTNPKLAWMFRNCFPNTLDTTVHFRKDSDGNPIAERVYVSIYWRYSCDVAA